VGGPEIIRSMALGIWHFMPYGLGRHGLRTTHSFLMARLVTKNRDRQPRAKPDDKNSQYDSQYDVNGSRSKP